jgi:hypothetical protein
MIIAPSPQWSAESQNSKFRIPRSLRRFGVNPSVEFGLGPDYTRSADPFHPNLGPSHAASFHEGGSRQLVSIRVISRSPPPPAGSIPSSLQSATRTL